MVRVIASEDCGNAPKKAQLRDFNIAFAEGDVDRILGFVSDNVTWNRVGDTRIEGRENFENDLRPMQDVRAKEVEITDIITHGNVGAAHGILRFENGQSYAFCDVYRFTSHARDAKIREITSYVIEVQE